MFLCHVCLERGFLSQSARTPSKSSQYFAGERLIRYFCDSLYRFSMPLEIESYHRFNNFPQGSSPDSSLFSSNEGVLRRYNRFMQEHSWAMKGPTVRTFSESTERGGRLHTNFQNIVNRRIPIRRSTLLSGKKIVEPDFSVSAQRTHIDRPPGAVVASQADAVAGVQRCGSNCAIMLLR